MNVALWTLAAVLAAVFLASGLQKLLRSPAELSESGLVFVEDFSLGTVRAIGAAEVLAALALVFPALLGRAPLLVPLAAAGLVLMMVGAAVVHQRRGESTAIVVSLVFLSLAAIVAVGRFSLEPFVA